MIDFHTHILPGMDDGCRTPEESLQALQLLKDQGITAAYLTPHFYAEYTDPENFLRKRQNSYDRLMDAAAGSPEGALPIPVKLGAEVLYFTGISRAEAVLPKLCYQGTNALLLEMPFHPWSDPMIDEVFSLQRNTPYQVILAHVDRYWDYMPDELIRAFYRSGIRMQLNCDSLLRWKSRRKAIKMIKYWQVHALTSDTHNLEERRPRFDEALVQLEKKGLYDQIEMFKEAEL